MESDCVRGRGLTRPEGRGRCLVRYELCLTALEESGVGMGSLTNPVLVASTKHLLLLGRG